MDKNNYLFNLIEIVNRLKNEKIKKIVLDILDNPVLSFSSTKPLISILESPAAPRKHHMFTSGLFIHTYSVVKIALLLCDVFEEIYGVNIDRDIVVATAVLHDIYKFYQYDRDLKEGGYKARDDWYLSHDYAVVAELAFRGASDDLIRVVSEVHGVVPIRTFEGLIVHLADSIDARFGEYLQNIVLSLLKEFESKECKPYAVIDEIVKKFGVKSLTELVRDRKKFLEIVTNICRNSKTSNDNRKQSELRF